MKSQKSTDRLAEEVMLMKLKHKFPYFPERICCERFTFELNAIRLNFPSFV